MAKMLTQRDKVIGRIVDTGKVTRNECLQNYITRLAAIIYDLEKSGWVFLKKERGGDYEYVVDRTCAPYVRAMMK